MQCIALDVEPGVQVHISKPCAQHARELLGQLEPSNIGYCNLGSHQLQGHASQQTQGKSVEEYANKSADCLEVNPAGTSYTDRFGRVGLLPLYRIAGMHSGGGMGGG